MQTMRKFSGPLFSLHCCPLKFVILGAAYMSFSATTVWAQGPSQGGSPTALPWWQVVTGVLAIPTAILGLVYTYRLSQKTRLESQKLQLDILEKEGKVRPETPRVIRRQDLFESPGAFAASIQEFVIRFIILYLAVFGWGLIERLINPSLNALLAVWINQQHIDVGQSWLGIFAVSLAS